MTNSAKSIYITNSAKSIYIINSVGSAKLCVFIITITSQSTLRQKKNSERNRRVSAEEHLSHFFSLSNFASASVFEEFNQLRNKVSFLVPESLSLRPLLERHLTNEDVFLCSDQIIIF